MKKKVNWKDRELLQELVSSSSSYADVLKGLGLQVVSSNTRTLKKYIEKYKINISHFDTVKETKVVIEKGREPSFSISGKLYDPEKGIRVEVQCDDALIDFLRMTGYNGKTDEEVFGLFLIKLYKDTGENMAKYGI